MDLVIAVVYPDYGSADVCSLITASENLCYGVAGLGSVGGVDIDCNGALRSSVHVIASVNVTAYGTSVNCHLNVAVHKSCVG